MPRTRTRRLLRKHFLSFISDYVRLKRMALTTAVYGLCSYRKTQKKLCLVVYGIKIGVVTLLPGGFKTTSTPL
jgi:hypothetical protein